LSNQSKDVEGSATQAVYLRGTVHQQVPLLTGQVYQLQDETGMVWVLTQDTVALGDMLLIQGQVRYEPIPLGGKEFGEIYVEEQQQIDRKTAESLESKWPEMGPGVGTGWLPEFPIVKLPLSDDRQSKSYSSTSHTPQL